MYLHDLACSKCAHYTGSTRRKNRFGIYIYICRDYTFFPQIFFSISRIHWYHIPFWTPYDAPGRSWRPTATWTKLTSLAPNASWRSTSWGPLAIIGYLWDTIEHQGLFVNLNKGFGWVWKFRVWWFVFEDVFGGPRIDIQRESQSQTVWQIKWLHQMKVTRG